MSLALALNNALSGLKINQQAIGVLSQNIANVNTVGYSRQVLDQSTVSVEGVGSGVKLDDITRKVDKYLQRSMQSQSSVHVSSQTLNDYYENLQALLGRPGASDSIDSFVTQFFNSAQQLAESPDTNSLKNNVVSFGGALARQLSDLAARIHDLRFEADGAISDAVSAVNSSLDRLKSINAALTQSVTIGQPSATLLDDRDQELNTLAQFMNITVSFSSTGSVGVVGGDGRVLLEDGVRHQLSYLRTSSVDNLIEDTTLNALKVLTINDSGQEVGVPTDLISAGLSSDVASFITGGSLHAYQQIRDVKFPAIIEQLDQLASRIRDEVNTVHNQGSGSPAATQLTGDRLVQADEEYDWSGLVRIAVLRSDGTAVDSAYADETSAGGIRPLTMDLARLNSGSGNGKPSIQAIIDEINDHFAAPQNKAKISNINNVRLVSDSTQLPSGSTPLFDFDLDLENISEDNADVFVTGITVLDDTGTDISSVTEPAPALTISPSSSYTTVSGSANVTITTTTVPNVNVGDKIYLNAPSAAVNGIATTDLTGFFTVTAVSGSTITFTAAAAATSSGIVSDPGSIQVLPPYATINAGTKERTRDRGQMQVDFSGNSGSAYYDITVNVSVFNPTTGTVTSAPITYRVTNGEQDLYNKRYSAQSTSAPGVLVTSGTSQESIRAMLVDEDGNELPTLNGKYVDGRGYLRLVGGNAGDQYTIAIDELDSKQLGKLDDLPPEAGTNWGFSHFFGLNNFFAMNQQIATGDTVKGSAYNLRVQDRLISDASLVSTGVLVQQPASVNTAGTVYTYVRYSGDNTIAQRFAKLNTERVSFDAAGGLPVVEQSIQSYTSQILGFTAQRSSEAKDNANSAKTLFDSFKSKAEAVSGVNLDEELANTVTLQNAYAASARVITTVNKMYEDLLQNL